MRFVYEVIADENREKHGIDELRNWYGGPISGISWFIDRANDVFLIDAGCDREDPRPRNYIIGFKGHRLRVWAADHARQSISDPLKGDHHWSFPQPVVLPEALKPHEREVFHALKEALVVYSSVAFPANSVTFDEWNVV